MPVLRRENYSCQVPVQYSLPPRLHVTADDDEFDEVLLQHFRQEGFDVTYLPCLINENDGSSGKKAYVNELKHLADDLEVGERYVLLFILAFFFVNDEVNG